MVFSIILTGSSSLILELPLKRPPLSMEISLMTIFPLTNPPAKISRLFASSSPSKTPLTTILSDFNSPFKFPFLPMTTMLYEWIMPFNSPST